MIKRLQFLMLFMCLMSSGAFACSNTFSLTSLPCNMSDHDKFWYTQTLILQVVDFAVSRDIRNQKPHYEKGCMKDCELIDIREGNAFHEKCAGPKPKTKNLAACMLVAGAAFHWLQYELPPNVRTVFNIGHTFIRFDVINSNIQLGLKAKW